MTVSSKTLARQHGQYYTPDFLVQALLRLALEPLLQERSPFDREPVRVLDPACGDGAFLRAAALRLSAWYATGQTPAPTTPPANGEIMARHLYGVEIDRQALSGLRKRERFVWPNLCWGDALTGPAFGELLPSRDDRGHEPGNGVEIPGVNWPVAFPEAALAGGFDLIIGNPPYRRELASRALLERLRSSPLGRRWHQPRLDLWGYFLHRGLDLLREGGRLAFVLPSYWTASTGAKKLIARLEAETTVCDVVLLGAARIFPRVEGRHLILSLRRGHRRTACRVLDLSASTKRLPERLAVGTASASFNLNPACHSTALDRVFHVKPAELFQQGQFCLSPPDRIVADLSRHSPQTLGERFDVRQGIAENPRRISAAIARPSRGLYRAGEGVFVLTRAELGELELNTEELALLRPYHGGTDVDRYHLAAEPSEFLLYLTRDTAPRLEAFPQVAKHLARFRPLLERRREVRTGGIAWWHLHWPREERIFLAPRILMPQMGHAPRFVYCDRPAFVGFSMHVIRGAEGRPEIPGPEAAAESLRALTGLLNSELALRWFRRYAKCRGAAFDISGSVLRQFPLPPRNVEAERALSQLVQDRQLARVPDQIKELEEEIEALVYRAYFSIVN